MKTCLVSYLLIVSCVCIIYTRADVIDTFNRLASDSYDTFFNMTEMVLNKVPKTIKLFRDASKSVVGGIKRLASKSVNNVHNKTQESLGQIKSSASKVIGVIEKATNVNLTRLLDKEF